MYNSNSRLHSPSIATFQPAVTLCVVLLLLLLCYAGCRLLPAAAGVLPVG
jgi:hypothetical protein